MTVEIEYVDYGAQGEYGFFGKRVARSIVRGYSEAQIIVEIEAMKVILGNHVSAIRVEEI